MTAAPRACPPAETQEKAMDTLASKAPALPTSMNVWRCWNCRAVIARLFLVPGCAVEIKCAKCNAFNTAAIEDKRRSVA